MQLLIERMASPIGTMLIVSDGQALRALDFEDYEARMHRLLRLHYGHYEIKVGHAPSAITERLSAYFAGNFDAVTGIEVATGGTAFQRLVWTALRLIPAGQSISYGELARRLDKPGASRAVGLANGANPIAIVVPCHRVVGSNATLTGYGGGLHRKRWLLAHEGAARWLPGFDEAELG